MEAQILVIEKEEKTEGEEEMQKGPQPAELQLSEHERNALEALVRRHGTPQQLAKRGRMILGAAEGERNVVSCWKCSITTLNLNGIDA